MNLSLKSFPPVLCLASLIRHCYHFPKHADTTVLSLHDQIPISPVHYLLHKYDFQVVISLTLGHPTNLIYFLLINSINATNPSKPTKRAYPETPTTSSVDFSSSPPSTFFTKYLSMSSRASTVEGYIFYI